MEVFGRGQANRIASSTPFKGISTVDACDLVFDAVKSDSTGVPQQVKENLSLIAI
jgi:hypothetical protein